MVRGKNKVNFIGTDPKGVIRAFGTLMHECVEDALQQIKYRSDLGTSSAWTFTEAPENYTWL